MFNERNDVVILPRVLCCDNGVDYNLIRLMSRLITKQTSEIFKGTRIYQIHKLFFEENCV